MKQDSSTEPESFSGTIQKDWENVAETVPGGCFVYRADGNYETVYANQRLLHIFGCESRDEFIRLTGGTFRGMVHPEDFALVDESIHPQIAESEKDIKQDF